MTIEEFMEHNISPDEENIAIWVDDDELAMHPLYSGLYEDMPDRYNQLTLDAFYIHENRLVLNVGADEVLEINGNLEY